MHKERYTRAAKGLMFTLAVPVSTALLLFPLVPAHLKSFGWREGLGEGDWAELVAVARRAALLLQFEVGLLLIGYWLVIAAFGRGEILRIRSANACMALSGSIFATGEMLAWQPFRPYHYPDVIVELLCPVLGISTTDATIGFDTATSCEAFSHAWAPEIFLTLPLVLLVASALLRILVSRHRFNGAQTENS